MKNLEKITDKIMYDALLVCQKMFDDAEKTASDIKAEGEARLASQTQEIFADAEAKIAADDARHAGGLSLLRRNAILAEKTAAIDEVFSRAAKNLSSEYPVEYKNSMIKLFSSAISQKNGEVCFSSRDESIADELFASFTKLFSENAGGFTLTRGKNLPICGGFILKYGDVTVDCSTEARVAEIRQSMERKVADILFGGNANG